MKMIGKAQRQRFHYTKEIRVWKKNRLFNYESPDERV